MWPGPSRPLAAVEQELLDAIALNPGDDELRRVLADWWMQGTDPARGEMVALQCNGGDASELLELYRKRWLGVLVDEGYALDFQRGFVRLPLVFEPGDPLADAADTRRVSPRVYVARRALGSAHRRLYVGRSWAGADVVIKGAWHDFTRGLLRGAVPVEDRLGDVATERSVVPRHPHVVELIDTAQLGGHEVLVYAWAGEPLADDVAYADDVVIAIGRQVASALAALHALDISHRHVRNDHVMVEDGHARLGGFGGAVKNTRPVAYSTDPDREPPMLPGRQFANMAPEQIRGGRHARPAADVFSLGVTLAHWCLGEHPLGDVERQNPMDVVLGARDRRHRLPTETVLAPLIEAMLAVDPDARPTAAQVEAQLAAFERA